MGTSKHTESNAKVNILEWERRFGFPLKKIAGVDEVGRGCLAGPVVAAVVVLPLDFNSVSDGPEWLSQVKDSKKLSSKKREELAPLIIKWALGFGVGFASSAQIDAINIEKASHLAMLNAIETCKVRPDFVLVDGLRVPRGLEISSQAVVKGDSRCLSIACASIVAKVWRDDFMTCLDEEIPGYFFGIHKGYPTTKHINALKERGVSTVHRKTYKPVAQIMGN